MVRIISACKTFFSATFPLLAEWSRLPSFVGWIALSCGIATQRLVPWNHVFSSILYNKILPVAIVLSIVAAIAVKYLSVRFLFFAIAGVALASSVLDEQHIVYNAAMRLCAGRQSVLLCGRIESIPVASFGEYRFTVRTDSVFTERHPGVLLGKTLTCFSFRKPLSYGRITARGSFKPPHPAENPGAFDDFQNSMSNNIWGRFYIDTILQCRTEQSFANKAADFARTTVTKACKQIQNSDYRAVIVASFLNDKSDLSNNMRNLFYKAGIYHLLALSGFNIAILAAALFAFLTLFPIGKTNKIVLVLICVWSYYFFIGPIPSLFRAVLMTTVVLAAFLFQRKPHALNSLGLAGIVWLILSPVSLFTPSYQLSFSATLGLIILYPVFTKHFMPRRDGWLVQWVIVPFCSILFVSVAAFAATAPVLAFQFGTLSLSGIIANLFAVTLMSIAMWLSLAGFFLQIMVPQLVPACMHTAEFVVSIMIRCSSMVAALPMATARIWSIHPLTYVLYALFCTGFCTIKTGLTRRYLTWAGAAFLLASVGLFLFSVSANPPHITSFYIKKASLTGIRWPNGKLWLVGTGPEKAAYSTFERVIIPWMRQNLCHTIDAIVLTQDPCNAVQSLEPLLKNACVKTVMALSSEEPSCADFSLFLAEFGMSLQTVDRGVPVIPAPRCTCMLMPRIVQNEEPVQPFKISMYNSTIIIPDNVLSASENKGAVSLVFSKSREPRLKQEISASHPLSPNVY